MIQPLHRLQSCLASSLLDEEHAEGDARGPFRMSLAGRCLRSLGYMAIGHPGRAPEARLLMARRNGTMVHDELQRRLPLQEKEREVALTLPCGVSLTGHIDGMIPDDTGPRVFEIKTITEKGFGFLQRAVATGDEATLHDAIGEGYLSQMWCYLNATGYLGYYLYYNKNTSHMLEFRLDKVPDEIGQSIDFRFGRLAQWLEQRGSDDLPPEGFREHEPVPEMFRKKPTGRMVLPWNCSYCDHVNECWPEAEFTVEKGKPIYIV